MTELEIMQRAKDYLDKLANGIDPLTDRAVPDEDVINNVRISRCLLYVSDVLRQVIENGGIKAKAIRKSERAPFSLSAETRSRYDFGYRSCCVSVIAQRLNELVNLNTTQKLKTTSITKFLLDSGLLCEAESNDGTKSKRPTELGRSLGISDEQRTGHNGEYTAVVYDRQAQHFILDNLDAVISINTEPAHANQGKPWAPEEDDYLQKAFQAGIDVKDLSVELKRSREAIRSRLKKLGLTE